MDHKIAYDTWLNNPKLSVEGVRELESIADDEKAIEYRFGAELKFGTAGMRGLIGMGTNMMNVYTVKRATQGLAEFIRSNGAIAMQRGVAISYDTRRKSEEFACAAAGVLIKNDIKVFIYPEGRPVPMLSYAVRKNKCFAGVMITASHNPKEYNGYKVYGEDGAQMSPEDTAKVVSHILAITDYFSVDGVGLQSVKDARRFGATILGWLFERKYYAELMKLSLSRAAVKAEGKGIKLVYTPVHGTGYVPVTTILKKSGVRVTVVTEQCAPDTEFSTVAVPNPEVKETLSMAIDYADRIKADVVFGTDPDCDRLGVAVRSDKGEFVSLTGNQVGVLMMNYVLSRLKQENKLKKDSFVVKSFVSTGLGEAVAASYGVKIYDVPVGFKYIGEKIKIAEKTGVGSFEFGFEESCGYLRGTHSRDKDAVVASMLFAELVCYYKSIGQSVFDVLTGIYKKFGYCIDRTDSIAFSGLSAMADMNKAVAKVAGTDLDEIGGYNIVATRNYETGIRKTVDGKEEKLEFENLNCLYYELESGGFICLRPSGTEPKLKIYYSVYAPDREKAQEAIAKLSAAFDKILRS